MGEPRQLWPSVPSPLSLSRALTPLTPKSHSPNPLDAALRSGFFPSPWLDAPAGGRSFDLLISHRRCLKSQSEGSTLEPSSPLWAPPQGGTFPSSSSCRAPFPRKGTRCCRSSSSIFGEESPSGGSSFTARRNCCTWWW